MIQNWIIKKMKAVHKNKVKAAEREQKMRHLRVLHSMRNLMSDVFLFNKRRAVGVFETKTKLTSRNKYRVSGNNFGKEFGVTPAIPTTNSMKISEPKESIFIL